MEAGFPEAPPPVDDSEKLFHERRMGYGTVGGFLGCLVPIILLVALLMWGASQLPGSYGP